MNKAHRVIWSSVRCAFVVTDEHGKTRSKPSSTRKALAIALSFGSLFATPYVLADIVYSGIGNSTTLNSITVDGNLVNTGSLFGGFRDNGQGHVQGINALIVNNSTLSGNLINSGALVGQRAYGLSLSNSTVGGNLINSGSMSGTAGLAMQQSIVNGNLVNSGVIDTTGYYGLWLTGGNTISGTLVNSGTLTGMATLDVEHTVIGNGLVNSGTIGGSLLINSASLLSGGVTNSGVIGSGMKLTNVSDTGDILNDGRVGSLTAGTGTVLAVSLFDGNVINTGTLLGPETALSVSGGDISGSLQNSGTITGGDTGLSLNGVSVGGALSNGGSISGATGISIVNADNQMGSRGQTTLSGDLANLGTGIIAGTSAGLVTSGTLIKGSVINNGLITGNDIAVSLTGTEIDGNLLNSGTISSSLGAALTLNNSAVSGVISNSGMFQGATTGLAASGSRLDVLINSGTISGGQYSVLSNDSSIQQINITGDNTAMFEGEVHTPSATVDLVSGSTYTLNNGNLFTVANFDNEGILRLSSDATATIAGNYVQGSDATLTTEAVDATHFGKLVVTGTATLADQAKFNVDVVNSGQSFSGATLASVLSAGTLNSNGSYAVTSNSALYNFSGVKNGNSVDLVAAPKSTTAVTQSVQGVSTANLSAARALDGAIATNSSLTPLFVGATSGSQVASAISQTLPSNAAAAIEVSQSTLSTITDVIQSRIDTNTGLASGDGFYGDKNLWMKPFGSWINQSQHGNTPGYDATVYGMAFGVDAPVNELLRLGVSFSYANADTNSKADVSAQSAKVDLYQLMGYGSYTVAPNTELSFHAGVGQNRNDGKRDLNLNGVGGQAKANYDSRTFTAGVALAKAYDISPTTRFIPSVRADYTYLKDDSYHESGSAAINPLLLDVDKHQTDQLILGLDGKVSHEIIPGTQITGNLGVGYDVIHDDSMLTSSYAGAPGSTFNTVGQSSSPWLARGGMGVATRIAKNGTELSVNYEAEARTNFTNQTVSLKLKMPF